MKLCHFVLLLIYCWALTVFAMDDNLIEVSPEDSSEEMHPGPKQLASGPKKSTDDSVLKSNEILSAQETRMLSKHIKTSPSLKTLSLASCTFGSMSAATALLQAIADNSSITDLKLTSNIFSECRESVGTTRFVMVLQGNVPGCKNISFILANKLKLKSLTLDTGDTKFHERHFQPFLDCLGTMHDLALLDLSAIDLSKKKQLV